MRFNDNEEWNAQVMCVYTFTLTLAVVVCIIIRSLKESYAEISQGCCVFSLLPNHERKFKCYVYR